MNGHDFTREQNMEARMMLAVARLERRPVGSHARVAPVSGARRSIRRL